MRLLLCILRQDLFLEKGCSGIIPIVFFFFFLHLPFQVGTMPSVYSQKAMGLRTPLYGGRKKKRVEFILRVSTNTNKVFKKKLKRDFGLRMNCIYTFEIH